MSRKYGIEATEAETKAANSSMNLREAAVPPYEIPSLLHDERGKKLSNAATYCRHERPRRLQLIADHMYGPLPPRPESLSFLQTSEDQQALGGRAIRREFIIRCGHRGQARDLRLLLYLTRNACQSVPVFFGLNFKGNASCTTDPGVDATVPRRYHSYGTRRYEDGRVTEEQRGLTASRWNFEEALERGYASATICYFDLYPDRPDGFTDSVWSMFMSEEEWEAPGSPYGAISAWAWGISRALDCLETQPEIDQARLIAHGLSRLGKVALWAGANDERIAMTVSICSGCCGAKLSRRQFGENFIWVDHWNQHWHGANFRKYLGREAELPFDQHTLLSLIAPRLLLINSATEDVYADPKGEFIAAREAAKIYQLFNAKGMTQQEMPEPETLVGDEVGYFLRKGPHACKPEDWKAMMQFADKQLKKKLIIR